MEMAPPTRCWLFKHEELALAPGHPHKKLSVLVPTCNHSARDAETEGSGIQSNPQVQNVGASLS